MSAEFRGRPLQWCRRCQNFHAVFPCACDIEIQTLKQTIARLQGRIANLITELEEAKDHADQSRPLSP